MVVALNVSPFSSSTPTACLPSISTLATGAADEPTHGREDLEPGDTEVLEVIGRVPDSELETAPVSLRDPEARGGRDVDLTQEVVIVVNGKERFRGMVERSFSTLMMTLPRNDPHLPFDARVDL